MFFPTPNVTEAFSDEKTVGSFITASTPFFSHVYRNGNVWCPREGWRNCLCGDCVRVTQIAPSQKRHDKKKSPRLNKRARGLKILASAMSVL